MFRVPGVSCPNPLKYYDAIYRDYRSFYEKSYPQEYPTYGHQAKLDNKKVLDMFLQHLKK